MSEHTSASGRALADFVDELLECGAVLSQVVSHMVRFEAAGLASPDAAPIPATAHKLICDVLSDVKPRRSRRDLATAAAIVKEATEAICQNLFFVDIDTTALGANGDLGAPGE